MSQRHRILLIDDNPDFRITIATRLTREGFDVTVAASGEEGLAAARGQPYDLVLLDMLMPEKDGVTTYQELRADPATRQMPIILLTGVAVEGHWEALPYETDGQAFILGKPYDDTILLARINQVLTEAGGRF